MTTKTEQLKIAFEPRPTNYQPNLITESRHEFTDMEKKIVVLAINQLRRVAQIWQSGQNIILLIPFSELTNSHHGKLSVTASGLNTKRIFYQDLTDPGKPEFDYITPFPRVRSIKINGKQHLELVMFADVVPAFIELGKRYTSYSLKLMLSLSSVYAQRMYEIVMMFYGRGQKAFTYEVSKLRTALNYPDKHDYYDFKRKALTIAQNELAKKIGLHVEFCASRKCGRSIVELRFSVKADWDLINNDVEAPRNCGYCVQRDDFLQVHPETAESNPGGYNPDEYVYQAAYGSLSRQAGGQEPDCLYGPGFGFWQRLVRG